MNATLAASLAALADHREQIEAAARRSARQLAIQLAERLVGRALQADPAEAAAWLDALIAAGRRDWLTIRVPPGVELAPQPAAVSIIVDPALRSGEVILEGPAGVVDGRIATRLARLAPDP